VSFVGVAWTGSDDDFQRFVDKHGITFPTISDDPGEVFVRFGVPSQPALVVVDAAGNTEQVFGAVEPELLRSILENVIAG
jgi:peroxiredoxin